MAVLTIDQSNEYASEAQVRNSVTEAADELRFEVESYGITDKEQHRTISVTFAGKDDDRPLLHKALAIAFAQHGYVLESIKVTAKAAKDTAQIRLPLGDN